MSDEPVDPRTLKLRKAMMYADSYGMTRDERISLSEIVLRRDITSWTQLSEAQLGRMLDVFEGHALVAHMLSERQPSRSTTA